MPNLFEVTAGGGSPVEQFQQMGRNAKSLFAHPIDYLAKHFGAESSSPEENIANAAMGLANPMAVGSLLMGASQMNKIAGEMSKFFTNKYKAPISATDVHNMIDEIHSLNMRDEFIDKLRMSDLPEHQMAVMRHDAAKNIYNQMAPELVHIVGRSPRLWNRMGMGMAMGDR